MVKTAGNAADCSAAVRRIATGERPSPLAGRKWRAILVVKMNEAERCNPHLRPRLALGFWRFPAMFALFGREADRDALGSFFSPILARTLLGCACRRSPARFGRMEMD